jgi:hypothetical protein
MAAKERKDLKNNSAFFYHGCTRINTDFSIPNLQFRLGCFQHFRFLAFSVCLARLKPENIGVKLSA